MNGRTVIRGDTLYVGSNNVSTNAIRFHGTIFDGAGSYNHTVIAENHYGGGESSELLLFKGNDGDDRVRVLAAGGFRVDVGGTITWNEGSAPPTATFQNALFINGTNGNVGIGTGTPQTRLHVQGGILNTLCNTGTTTADANLIIRNALDSGIHRIQFYTALNPGNYSGLVGTNDKAIIFTDGSLETGNLVIGPHSGSAFGIKIMSNGRVGIGVASPGYTLDVNGSINGSVGVLSNGTFLTSDRRVKENILDADLNICYSNIKSLPLRRFTFISSFKTTKYDGSQIGFIADEVSSIFPKSVNEYEVDISGYSTINHVNYDQIFITNYGATQKLIQIVEGHTSTFEQISTSHQTFEQRFSSLEAMLLTTQSTCLGLQEEVSTLKG